MLSRSKHNIAELHFLLFLDLGVVASRNPLGYADVYGHVGVILCMSAVGRGAILPRISASGRRSGDFEGVSSFYRERLMYKIPTIKSGR